MKIDARKILTPGTVLLGISVLLGLVAVILYAVNVTSVGYFQGVTSALVPALGIVAVLCGALAIGSGLFQFDGLVGKIVDGVRSVLVILVPVLFMVCFLGFISARVEGLAFIFGSDANLLEEIQTPENMSSAMTAIVGFVFFAIASIVGIVASFFSITKKEKKAEPAVENA